MLKFRVAVFPESSGRPVTYDIVAANLPTARLIAFLLDGGQVGGPVNRGTYALAAEYTDVLNVEGAEV